MASADEILQQISPYLLYGGLGLLQRGDPFQNLQQGLLIGRQVSSQDEMQRREKQRREALQKLAKSLTTQPSPTTPTGPTPARPTGGMPQTNLPPGVFPHDLSLGMTQAMQAQGGGPPPPTLLDQAIDPETGRLRPISDARLQAIAPTLPQIPVPGSLMPQAGAPPTPPPGIPPGFGGPGQPPPAPPMGQTDQIAQALIGSGDEQLMMQGIQMLQQSRQLQGRQQFQAQQAAVDRGFRARESELQRQLRQEESARKARLTREENALDRQLRRELAADANRMKALLAQQKASIPKDASDATRRVLAGGETMLESLDKVERQIARGFDPSSFVGQIRELGGTLTTSDERLDFNANYNRVVEGIVQAAAGVASDQDVERMMNLYRPRIGDSPETFRTRYVSLLTDALGLFRRVAGRTPPNRQNPEQQFASQMAGELERRIARIEGAPGYEGFSPVVGQRGVGPTVPMPNIDFDTASLEEIERSLGGL